MSFTLTSALVFLLSLQSANAQPGNSIVQALRKDFGTTFGPCKTVGSTCSKSISPYLNRMKLADTSASQCYNITTKLTQDGLFRANYTDLQCLPTGYAGETTLNTINPNGNPLLLNISNSIFDDCSPTAASDMGCGLNLECNKYTISGINKWSCDPAPGKEYSLDVQAHANQTCGNSTPHKTACRADLGLKCVSVTAIIAGVIVPNGKSICLHSTPVPTPTTLVKRGVRVGGPQATNYCYSGCSGVKAI